MFARILPWPYLFFFLSPTDLKSLMDNVGHGLKNITATTHLQQQRQHHHTRPTPSLSLRPRVVSLNVMVAGLSGLGKTTTCAALLESWQQQQQQQQGGAKPSLFSSSSAVSNKKEKPKITKEVDPSRQFERFDAKTNTILRVRIIDTPGFGNRVDHRDAVRPIVSYMHKCRRNQYQAETSPTLPDKEVVEACDDLVHVCLYFLSPGRFLEMDAYFLSRIQHEVCIIPVIAKADTLTNEELTAYRAEVVKAFAKQGIVPYDFDARDKEFNRHYNSNNHYDGTNIQEDSSITPFCRGRRAGEALAVVARDGMYPWGEVRSLDPVHSDLILVRDLLLSQHTETFVELAREKYGVYLAQRIRRHRVADAVKLVALGLLTARALGVPLPFMEHLTPTEAWIQMKRFAVWISQVLTNVLPRSLVGSAAAIGNRVKDGTLAEIPSTIESILPTNEDLTPTKSKEETSLGYFSWLWGK